MDQPTKPPIRRKAPVREAEPPQNPSIERKRQRLAERHRDTAKNQKKSILPRLPKESKKEVHDLLDEMFGEAVDMWRNIPLEPGQDLDRRASDYAIKDFIRCVEKWVADKKNDPTVKKAMRNFREAVFPRKWMERDPEIAKMMRRAKHFNAVCNFLYDLTANRKECEYLSAVAAIEGPPHAIFEGGKGFHDKMVETLGVSLNTANAYLRALTEAGILRKFGTYHKRLYSIGLWKRRPDQSWNRILYVSDTPEWRERLANLKVIG